MPQSQTHFCSFCTWNSLWKHEFLSHQRTAPECGRLESCCKVESVRCAYWRRHGPGGDGPTNLCKTARDEIQGRKSCQPVQVLDNSIYIMYIYNRIQPVPTSRNWIKNNISYAHTIGYLAWTEKHRPVYLMWQGILWIACSVSWSGMTTGIASSRFPIFVVALSLFSLSWSQLPYSSVAKSSYMASHTKNFKKLFGVRARK